MVLNFTTTLAATLVRIGYTEEHHELIVHPHEEVRSNHNTDKIINIYGKWKWKVVDLLNEKYNKLLPQPFDLYNWLDYQEQDEVAYFLSEAGSNVLSYAEFKAPHKFQLWFGAKGFVIGIEQKGKGFNAQEVHDKTIKDNKGAAFDFFRRCKSTIFFDNPSNARIVFMEFLW